MYEMQKKYGRGQAQTKQQQPMGRDEVKEVLNNLIRELDNAIQCYRDALGSPLSGVALSGDLGAKYALECALYLNRRI